MGEESGPNYRWRRKKGMRDMRKEGIGEQEEARGLEEDREEEEEGGEEREMAMLQINAIRLNQRNMNKN